LRGTKSSTLRSADLSWSSSDLSRDDVGGLLAREEDFRMLHGGRKSARLIGADEAGAGAWAGPVYAAAVCFEPDYLAKALNHLKGLHDSKRLSRLARERLNELMVASSSASWIKLDVQRVEADEIDELNVLRARFKAMTAASLRLSVCQIDVYPWSEAMDSYRA